MYNVYQVKLKHLELFAQEDMDYKTVMEEVFQYKNTWIDRNFRFRKVFTNISKVITEVQAIDITKLDIHIDTKIKYPSDIDRISFQARLEMDSKKGDSVVEHVTNVIALACFETHFNRSFDSDSKLFIKFKEYILEQPMIHMMGLYNSISKAIKESDTKWNKLFLQMHVVDKDYEEAGGPAILGRFNLLTLVKKVMKDFNCKYGEAFLKPYSLIQMNSLESASNSYIQDRMTKIKERNLKRQQTT